MACLQTGLVITHFHWFHWAITETKMRNYWCRRCDCINSVTETLVFIPTGLLTVVLTFELQPQPYSLRDVCAGASNWQTKIEGLQESFCPLHTCGQTTHTHTGWAEKQLWKALSCYICHLLGNCLVLDVHVKVLGLCHQGKISDSRANTLWLYILFQMQQSIRTWPQCTFLINLRLYHAGTEKLQRQM